MSTINDILEKNTYMYDEQGLQHLVSNKEIEDIKKSFLVTILKTKRCPECINRAKVYSLTESTKVEIRMLCPLYDIYICQDPALKKEKAISLFIELYGKTGLFEELL